MTTGTAPHHGHVCHLRHMWASSASHGAPSHPSGWYGSLMPSLEALRGVGSTALACPMLLVMCVLRRGPSWTCTFRPIVVGGGTDLRRERRSPCPRGWARRSPCPRGRARPRYALDHPRDLAFTTISFLLPGIPNTDTRHFETETTISV